MIFYCDELDEIIIYIGDADDGEVLRRQWITSPWFVGSGFLELEKDFVFVGYL